MKYSLRILLVSSVVCLGVGCNKEAKPTSVETEVETKAEEKTEEAEPEAPSRPERVRVSRPDEFFRVSLEGPGFEKPQTFEVEPDDTRINVIVNRSALQYVTRGLDPAVSADGSRLLMTQIQFAGATATS